MSCSVYWIHHPSHTDIFTQGYIGISNNVKNRFESHKNRPSNTHLKNAINKYKWDNLVKEVVLVADKAYCLMIELKLRTEDNVGWNIIKGGGMPPDATGTTFNKGKPAWNKNVPCSENTKLKLSEALKGRSVWNKGLETPFEVKQKQSLAKIGKPSPRLGMKNSPEHIAKIIANRPPYIMSQTGKDSLIKANTGRKHKIVTCPHCSKSGGITAMPRWHFNNCKERII
jgi:hypothetical protein